LNIRTALLGLFVALTIVLASATVYASGIRTTLTSTSTLTQNNTVTETRMLTVISNSTLTQTTTRTVSSNNTSLVVTEEITTVLQVHSSYNTCLWLIATSTNASTNYVFPAGGSQGVLTVATTTTTITLPDTTTINSTANGSGPCV
jgi:hypothetical protein